MSVSSDSKHTWESKKKEITVRPVESNFTSRNLLDLNNEKRAWLSPLASIALIDLNAFFAQVEQIRLDLDKDDPVVCAQWQTLIAISYAARKFGINRMDTIKSAQSKCPNLIIAHAAVFKKGESNWSYTDYKPDQATHKVSLEPYRRESRKIIKVYQRNCDLVEKASVDECYLDLSRKVYTELVNYFPHLISVKGTDQLPTIPSELPSDLTFVGETMNETQIDGEESESDLKSIVVSDWDDICMMIGSRILFQIRCDVYKSLGYTTSGGLARNKLLAKLGAGFEKPDNQTIIQTSQIENFLTKFELTDLTSMGGKTGEYILQKLNIPHDEDSIRFIRDKFSLTDLERLFSEESSIATRIYNIVRGDEKQELSYKVDVKSMMSSKNFATELVRLADAEDWIKVFVGDIYSRLTELDEENLNIINTDRTYKPTLRRPKTLNVNLTTSTYDKYSKQTQISVMRSLDKLKDNIQITSMKLLREVIDTYTSSSSLNRGKSIKDSSADNGHINVVPIIRMAIAVSNFVVLDDTSPIDSMMEKFATSTQHRSTMIEKEWDTFKKAQSLADNAEPKEPISIRHEQSPLQSSGKRHESDDKDRKKYTDSLFVKFENENPTKDTKRKLQQSSSEMTYNDLKTNILQSGECPICKSVGISADEHVDYHVALDLSMKMNGNPDEKPVEPLKKKKRTGKVQSKLPF